ncbi:hypothetical protein [Chryseobacterium wanjuense]
MKKIILLATFGVAGMMSANITATAKIDSKIYNPIKITSSCGYTQYVIVEPNDDPLCYLVDADQMEIDCDSPFENPQYGYNP